MKGHKPVWIRDKYIGAAKQRKRESPQGSKVAIMDTINECVEIGMKKKGLLKTETVKA